VDGEKSLDNKRKIRKKYFAVIDNIGMRNTWIQLKNLPIF
jgi:hypothetical protein